MKRPLSFSLFAIAFAACGDPAHSQAVDDLGPEAPGVEEGPLHRPGQPCVTCHGASGPGPKFTVGGTVYAAEGRPEPAPGIVVNLTDARNRSASVRTNQVGNFYLEEKEWDPTYPVSVSLAVGTRAIDMRTKVGRSGSCADCHRGPGGPATMPGVFVEAKKP